MYATRIYQLELPFGKKIETRAERLERILSGQLRHKLRTAADLSFDYQAATRIATRHNATVRQ